MHRKIGQIHHEGPVVARGIQRHHAVVPRRHRRYGVQIHCRGQHAAAIVVGVVADDLGAARRGDKQLRLAGKLAAKRVRQRAVALGLIYT